MPRHMLKVYSRIVSATWHVLGPSRQLARWLVGVPPCFAFTHAMLALDHVVFPGQGKQAPFRRWWAETAYGSAQPRSDGAWGGRVRQATMGSLRTNRPMATGCRRRVDYAGSSCVIASCTGCGDAADSAVGCAPSAGLTNVCGRRESKVY